MVETTPASPGSTPMSPYKPLMVILAPSTYSTFSTWSAASYAFSDSAHLASLPSSFLQSVTSQPASTETEAHSERTDTALSSVLMGYLGSFLLRLGRDPSRGARVLPPTRRPSLITLRI